MTDVVYEPVELTVSELDTVAGGVDLGILFNQSNSVEITAIANSYATATGGGNATAIADASVTATIFQSNGNSGALSLSSAASQA